MTTNTEAIDWAAAEQVASMLGPRTRKLVAARDPEAIRQWALRMHRDHSDRSVGMTYLELAALFGPVEEVSTDAA